MKRRLSLVLTICLCMSILCGSALADVVDAGDGQGASSHYFPDVPATAPYAEAVNALHEYGIINGDNKGNFNPNSFVTRAEAAAIICRLLGIEENAKQASTTSFTDVPTNHWANGYVAKAAEQGIINGYGDGKFGPSDSVTYAQMIKMLVCAWGYEENAQFAGGWPNGFIEVAQNTGICKDVNAATPSNGIERSNVAVLCYNTLNIVQGNFLEADA